MFQKIRYKLFFAILFANGLMMVIVYFSANWIFSTSFREYLDRAEAERLSPMVSELATLYQQHHGWHWVRQRGESSWHRLMQQYVVPESQGRRPPRPKSRDRLSQGSDNLGFEPPPYELTPLGPPPPPASDHPLQIHPRMLLLDADQRLVIGRPGRERNAYLIPVEVGGEVVGYLGFVRHLEITAELDQLFAERIENYLAWLLAGMLIVSAVVAILLARRLVKPVEELRAAVHELASGNYQVTLRKHGNDEIGDLQSDFNSLALTMEKNTRARQRWIADISHELRTPVAVLQGEVEAILDGIRPVDTGSIKSLHEEILRLSRLVNDLHDLSLSDVGAMSYKNREIDIVALLRKVVEYQSRISGQDGIDIELLAPEEPLVVFADKNRLEQLFANLGNNSRLYSTAPGRIRITVSKTATEVHIDWSDSDPGVGDADLDRLFDRLYRVDSSRSRNTGGSGLGLSICRNIVEATRGGIVAENSTLGGVSIKITFPLVDR